MKDFTKKGTKLPVIPVGTEYSIPNIFPEICKFKKKNQNYESRKDFISYGAFNETWIKAEVKNYSSDDYYLFKLSTIERLAKEQGMLDDDKEFTIKPPYNAITVTLPCGHDTEVEIGQTIKYEDCEQCKTNQMNPKVTLQENGTITVTDTETTTTLSKTTVDEICRLIKEDGWKKSDPRELNKWYESNEYLIFYTGNNQCYGFSKRDRKYHLGLTHTESGHICGEYQPATPETVEQYLTDEAVRRGFNGKVKFKPIGSHNEVIRDGNENAFGFDESLNQLLYCNYVVFRDGAWSEIIKPETITRAEAEKQLGKVITD